MQGAQGIEFMLSGFHIILGKLSSGLLERVRDKARLGIKRLKEAFGCQLKDFFPQPTNPLKAVQLQVYSNSARMSQVYTFLQWYCAVQEVKQGKEAEEAALSLSLMPREVAKLPQRPGAYESSCESRYNGVSSIARGELMEEVKFPGSICPLKTVREPTSLVVV